MPQAIGRLLYATSADSVHDSVRRRFKAFVFEDVELIATDIYRIVRVTVPRETAEQWGIDDGDVVYDFIYYGNIEEVCGCPVFYDDPDEPAYMDYAKIQKVTTGAISDRIGTLKYGKQIIFDAAVSVGFDAQLLPNCGMLSEPDWDVYTIDNRGGCDVASTKPSLLFRTTIDGIAIDYILSQCVHNPKDS
jgi:hypothetical protein